MLVQLLKSRCFAQAGVEESRKEEALHTASWLVFWANGPAQAHECFCGDELAVREIRTSLLRHACRSPIVCGDSMCARAVAQVSAERRGDELMLARILCGQALCEMHIRVDSQKAAAGRGTDAGTSISECLDSAEEHLSAFEATAGDPEGSSVSSVSRSDGSDAIGAAAGTAGKRLRRRTANTVLFSDQVGDEVSGETAAAFAELSSRGGETSDGSREESGALRAQLADRLALRVFIQALRCLNMLWEAKNSDAPDDALLAVLPTLQPLATKVASDLLMLTRNHDDEEVLARPEYVEGFGAVTAVLLEMAELRAKQCKQAAAQSLQLTAFHCALAAEHFSRATLSYPRLPLCRCCCCCSSLLAPLPQLV